MHFCPSNDLRDEHLGRLKDREYGAWKHDEMENHVSGRRKGSLADLGIGGTPSSVPAHYKRLKYELHVSNIPQRLTNGESEINLFCVFKKYGYIDVKMKGNGKDRHAFIIFYRMEQAREALNRMHHSLFFGQNLDVTWSRNTLNHHPEVMDGAHSGDRRPVSKPNNCLSSRGGGVGSPKMGFYVQEGGSNNYPHDSAPPYSSSRDINCFNVSPEPPPQRLSRSQFLHGLNDLPGKDGSAHIINPTATRNQFVGNLGHDTTERRLCGLFNPYGRIECISIKN